MPVQTGLERLIRDDFRTLIGRKVGLLCNQASIASDFSYALDHFRRQGAAGRLELVSVFGPQHGLFGHTQDNMIEWEPGSDGASYRLHSLYGQHREPTPGMLAGIDTLVVDLQDVGARYYTFVWTMALCMKACEKLGIEVWVLDRPNPISGNRVEGPGIEAGFESFVGLYSLPIRHGRTIGEIARWLQELHFPSLTLNIVEMEGWERSMYFDETGIPWAMPSPNMPTLDTAIVYPGACLLEGTNMSEGRGTSRPFEIFGAPYLDSWRFADALNRAGLAGCVFRPLDFQPTFNKHSGKVCGGCQLHVTDRDAFQPVLTYVAVMQEAVRQAGLQSIEEIPRQEVFTTTSPEVDLPGFAWKVPPYEYEFERLPIEILGGGTWLRDSIEALSPLDGVRDRISDQAVPLINEL